LEVRTSRAIQNARDAIVEKLSDGKYMLSIQSADAKPTGEYRHQEIEIMFAPGKKLHASSS